MVQITERRTPYYKNVKNVPPSVVRELYKKGEVTIVDIRNPWEYEDHHIPGAILIPMEYCDILLPKLETKQIVLVCEHANRTTWLINSKPELFEGKTVYNMLGGMELWMNMGYETTYGMDSNGMFWKDYILKKVAPSETLKK
ncbi:rhodanese-like domain-containing protein [Sulfolobus acidocaldarius]|uniref:Conserved protein n=4 Tax=Sulfolobus acidocaldarius TaxID=2285 RepID=Q4J6M8_SULAC|nr:rhodanese-like domain-containing protein [Sulfolobus acidocaldarius]AAY81553.1 conserved protein [Sulfolobus acidocaldarius DSM 639]AGE72156.1 hypothetical protein SacN8_11050 [Sulfolobus acidocaldarius N8]AGE74473.1 hypothetical protein SacRon12I_11295 [Sulfolobus acidocaldarius Ron12/I]ALU29672.1 rhodanese [Sulfolobus acidocaldarius]ALU32407.1 rhodanese [Sulfolobus acidocaldarius]